MDACARIPVGPPVNKPLPSYWQEPKSPLANVIEPETDNATKPYDYAIIGSGISGTMIAHNLIQANQSARIVMLEARKVCSGATGRNGGHTKAGSYRTYMDHMEKLGKEEALKIARMEYANIIATHNMAMELEIDCESQMCNTVDAVYDAELFEKGKAAIEALQSDATDKERENQQMAWYKVCDKAQALENGYHLAPKNGNGSLEVGEELAGTFEYLAGRIHSYKLTTGVLQECVRKGLRLCANTPVHAILPSDTTLDPSKSYWDIFTQYNTVKAEHVILATNGYTPYLLQSLQGVIVPMRGQITAQKPGPSNKLTTPLPTTYSFIYRNGYEYMVPRPLPDGTQHIVIGGGLGRLPASGASEFGTVDDSSLNARTSKYLRGTLSGYFGSENWGLATAEGSVVQEWTGIMGATGDGRPFVGEVPGKKGMWISAGFNGHGMVLCLKSAEALASMIVGAGKPEWFPESFLIHEQRLANCRFRGVLS